MRSEGDQFLECLDELLEIGRRADCAHRGLPPQGGRPARTGTKMQLAIDRIERARDVRPAGDREHVSLRRRRDLARVVHPAAVPRRRPAGARGAADRPGPAGREMAAAIRERSDDCENLFLGRRRRLRRAVPRRPRPTARRRAASGSTRSAGDLGHRRRRRRAAGDRGPRAGTGVAGYFIIDEANIELGLRQPWVSIGSDAEAHQAIAPFTDEETHPRTYGTFARFLGRYVRDRRVTTFADGDPPDDLAARRDPAGWSTAAGSGRLLRRRRRPRPDDGRRPRRLHATRTGTRSASATCSSTACRSSGTAPSPERRPVAGCAGRRSDPGRRGPAPGGARLESRPAVPGTRFAMPGRRGPRPGGARLESRPAVSAIAVRSAGRRGPRPRRGSLGEPGDQRHQPRRRSPGGPGAAPRVTTAGTRSPPPAGRRVPPGSTTP